MIIYFFFFKQKTAYEMRISDWSSDVCSSDLEPRGLGEGDDRRALHIAALFFQRRIHGLGQAVIDDAEHPTGLQHRINLLERLGGGVGPLEAPVVDRKSTRLNSSH